uniref:Large ribosomal subunit protein uL3c n=1 Tax=Pteridomonas sp. YPF1301 TaxID=2766739 RepID=A0A7G1MQQ5_9STRA|nr:ribosomal protein L3 [Pteridomonas sp. YPF1301]
MIILLGYKLGMTQLFESTGKIAIVTVLKIGPCFISQIKQNKFLNLTTIQLGYNSTFVNKITKANVRHFDTKNIILLQFLREYTLPFVKNLFLGKSYTTILLKKNDLICIRSYSIGKGFQGTRKRYNFNKGPMTHGSKNHKKPGSIGQGTTPGRVFVGKKLAGHLGIKKNTLTNIQIVKINYKENLLFVKGTIGGKYGNLVTIFKTSLEKKVKSI